MAGNCHTLSRQIWFQLAHPLSGDEASFRLVERMNSKSVHEAAIGTTYRVIHMSSGSTRIVSGRSEIVTLTSANRSHSIAKLGGCVACGGVNEQGAFGVLLAQGNTVSEEYA